MKPTDASTERSKHTPGPWNIRPGYGQLKSEIGPDNRAVATVWVKKMKASKDDTNDRAEPWSEGEANARLIAAAPDLLNALEVLSNAAEARGIHADAARAAIARARGL